MNESIFTQFKDYAISSLNGGGTNALYVLNRSEDDGSVLKIAMLSNVSNLNRSIEWYESILGFKVTGSYPSENPIYAHFDCLYGAQFSIAVDDRVPSNARFNFDVSDVDTLWESLKDKVEIVEELFDTPYGTRKFTIRDLDGNELGFVKC